MCDAVGKRLARLIMKAMKPLPVRRDPVEALPEEVLSLVWRLLDLKDLLSACLVSRQWHASLSSDNVWKRYTDSRQTEDHKKRRPAKRDEAKTCSRSWKNKFLSQRSLLHNWSKNRYHTCIKTPITGDVSRNYNRLHLLISRFLNQPRSSNFSCSVSSSSYRLQIFYYLASDLPSPTVSSITISPLLLSIPSHSDILDLSIYSRFPSCILESLDPNTAVLRKNVFKSILKLGTRSSGDNRTHHYAQLP